MCCHWLLAVSSPDRACEKVAIYLACITQWFSPGTPSSFITYKWLFDTYSHVCRKSDSLRNSKSLFKSCPVPPLLDNFSLPLHNAIHIRLPHVSCRSGWHMPTVLLIISSCLLTANVGHIASIPLECVLDAVGMRQHLIEVATLRYYRLPIDILTFSYGHHIVGIT